MGRWLHAAILPLLFVLGAGKLTMVLGGAGQGTPSGETWATAFLGPGPWGSLAPALPSQPSQAYEGIATLVILVALMLALWLGAFARRDGRVLFVGLAAWAFARAAVAITWRDQAVVGGLNMGSLIAIGVGVGSLAVLFAMTVRRARSRGGHPGAAADDGGRWAWLAGPGLASALLSSPARGRCARRRMARDGVSLGPDTIPVAARRRPTRGLP